MSYFQVYTFLTKGSQPFFDGFKERLFATYGWEKVRLQPVCDQHYDGTDRSMCMQLETPHPPKTGFDGANHGFMINHLTKTEKHHAESVVVLADVDCWPYPSWTQVLDSMHQHVDALFTPKFSSQSSPFFSSVKGLFWNQMEDEDARPGHDLTGHKTIESHLDTLWRWGVYCKGESIAHAYYGRMDGKDFDACFYLRELKVCLHQGGARHGGESRVRSLEENWVDQLS